MFSQLNLKSHGIYTNNHYSNILKSLKMASNSKYRPDRKRRKRKPQLFKKKKKNNNNNKKNKIKKKKKKIGKKKHTYINLFEQNNDLIRTLHKIHFNSSFKWGIYLEMCYQSISDLLLTLVKTNTKNSAKRIYCDAETNVALLRAV